MVKNNKGQISEGLLIVLTLVLCVYSGYAVYTFEKNTAAKINSPEKLFGMYNSEDNFEVYGKQAFKIMAHQAFSEIMPEIISEIQKENEKCKSLADGTLILDDSCLPSKLENQNHFVNDELEEQFAKLFSKYDHKHKFSLQDNLLVLDFDQISANVSDKAYNASYSYSKSFSTAYPIIEDFSDIYSKVKEKQAACQKSGLGKPSFDVIQCSGNLTLEQWISDCKSESPLLICSFKTKSNYFYNESFKPVEIRAAVKIL